jgi:phosphate starvation-inducible membrane PsiE
MAYFELAALLIAYNSSTKFSNLQYLLYINIPSFFFVVQQPKSGLIVDVSRSLSIRQTRARAHALGLL